MSGRARLFTTILAFAAALVLPAAAWAHAALLRTEPSASGVVNSPPAQVKLSYSEAVETRFTIVSVTDADGRQQTAGPPRRSPAGPDEVEVPLSRLAKGWYLVFWRVISADGHPVRGAFTFAVGPNPGPAPQFVIPSVSETAATTTLVIARWFAFLTFMSAIGLFVFRTVIARPLVARVSTRLRALSIAFWVAIAAALIATPVYVLLATAKFSLRSAWSVADLVPLMRVSSFGRAFLDLELVLALFALAAGIALWLDRPGRRKRSVAELLALTGALGTAAAVLLAPGASGHAAQASPRSLALALDWLHLAAGSVWIGGLIGLLVLWRSLPVARRLAGLAVCVPRFSNTAFVSVMVLIGSGVGASFLHLPTFRSLWETSYGKSLVLKIAVLLGAMLLAAVNLARTKPRLQAAVGHRPDVGPGAATLLRRLVGGEVVLVATAVFGAALLTSLAPPAKALGQIGKATATVGPGPVSRTITQGPYRLELLVAPNRAAVPNRFAVRLTRDRKPVNGAEITTSFTMLEMEMGTQAYRLSGTGNGLYQRSAPALVMVGRWGLSFDIRPPGASPFTVILVDHARG